MFCRFMALRFPALNSDYHLRTIKRLGFHEEGCDQYSDRDHNSCDEPHVHGERLIAALATLFALNSRESPL